MCRGWCELSQLLFGWGQILYLELFAGHEESRRWNGKSTPVIKFSYFHFMEEAWNYPTFHFHSHFRYKARRHEIEINSAIKVSNTKTLFTLALENCLISNVMWLNNLFDCQYVQLRIQECFIIRFTNHLSVEALQVLKIGRSELSIVCALQYCYHPCPQGRYTQSFRFKLVVSYKSCMRPRLTQIQGDSNLFTDFFLR